MAIQHGKALPVYVGRYNLRGYGLGGTIMSNIFKYAIPLLKPIAQKVLSKVKKEALQTGQNIAQDVFIHKMKPKKAIKKRTMEAFKRFKDQTGAGKQKHPKAKPKAQKKSGCTLGDIFINQAKKRTKPQSTKVKKKPRH